MQSSETEPQNLAHLMPHFRTLTERYGRVCFLAAIIVLATLPGAGQTSVLTQHNDIGRTGQNTHETILTTLNVNVNKFGKLFALPVTGQIYAQPLYVPNVTIKGNVHNVLIVATEGDFVYAFDADSAGPPLWRVSLVSKAHGAGANEHALESSSTIGCTDLQPSIGISSTPVIDPIAGTIYVEAKSQVGTTSTYIHRLHALDLATGSEKPPGPVVITATVPGTGDGSVNGMLTFDDLHQHNRPGLLLQNGSIYVGFASHCDYGPYHGWLFAYDTTTFARESVLVTTPNGGLGGFWMAGSGIAADSGGNIYMSSGNGDFDTTNVPATELGDTVLKVGTTSGQLSLVDYFTPSDEQCLDNEDADLGSGGVLVLPDQPGAYPHILVAAGKEGAIYVVNRDKMTLGNVHFENSNNCTSNDPEILEESGSGAIGGMWSMPAYWNNTLYFWGSGDTLKSIPLVNGLPSFAQTVSSSRAIGFPGATPSISSNGTLPKTAIVWAIDSSQYGSPGPGPGPAVLYAYDATDVTKELWDSTQAAFDRAGLAVKFSVPTVVNGKVYIGTSAAVNVYGLLPVVATPVMTPASGTYTSPLQVKITDTVAGAAIYYTTDGTIPTKTHGTLYTSPFTLTASATVRAVAFHVAYANSAIGSASYTVVP